MIVEVRIKFTDFLTAYNPKNNFVVLVVVESLWSARTLFPNTKFPKDRIQNIIIPYRPCYFADAL